MFDYPVYLFYRAVTDLLVLLPLPFLFAMGQICGAIAWLFLPQYRKLALRNVRIAFGDELSETEMRRIVRRHFRWLGANLLCSVKFTRMPMEKILERVRLENFELVENCFRQKKPFVLLISHIGSWEFCTRLSHFSHGQRTATIINASAIGTLIGTFGRPAADLVWRSLSAAKGSAKRLSCYAAAAGSAF